MSSDIGFLSSFKDAYDVIATSKLFIGLIVIVSIILVILGSVQLAGKGDSGMVRMGLAVMGVIVGGMMVIMALGAGVGAGVINKND